MNFFTQSPNQFILKGEADHSIVELVKYEAFNNESRIVQHNLDNLPFPDRSVYYDHYPHLKNASSKQFMTGRGCPYNCSFCANHLYKKLYGIPTKEYVRQHSPQYIVDHMYEVKKEYGYKTVSFTDDVLALNVEWLEEFMGLYEHIIHVPFMCNLRGDNVNHDVINLLKQGGCFGVSMGVESGSDRILRNILHKGETVNQMLTAANEIKEAGFKLKTYNMIGLPGETLNEAWDTVKVNQIMKPDHTSCSFLTPYPDYKVCEYYDDLPEVTDSIYKPNEDIPREIVNLQTFFYLAVKFPRMQSIIKALIKLRPNPLFRLGALGMYGVGMARVHRLSIGDVWRYSRHINPFRI